MANAHINTLRELQGLPEVAYTNTARAMESLWGSDWTALSLLEQLAIIADWTAVCADGANDVHSYTELAQIYRRNIGPNIKSYAACMLQNLRAAL